ncbi:MAG: hypothetical protein Q8940_13175 [Bacteroidota bacterium]|nr:hypothetical protein [Bacteroidota bacterium]
MNLISFLFKSRIKFYFTGKGATSRILGLIGFSFLAIFYGFVIGFFLDNSYREINGFDRFNLIRGINLFVFVSTLTRAYLPSYKPKMDLISSVYPVSLVRRFFIDWLMDFLYPYFFVFLLFFSVVKATSAIYDLSYFFQSLIVLLSAHIIRRIIQTFAERKTELKFFEFILIISTALVSSFVLIQNNVLKLNHNFLSLALTFASYITLSVVDYIVSSSVIELKRVSTQRRNTLLQKEIFNSFYTSFIFKNRAARKSILVAFLLKVVIMLLDLVMMAHNNTHLFDNIYVVFIYVSPLILYSYVYSNTWGFYRTLWLTVDKCTSGFKPLFLMQMKIMILPFTIDLLLASVYFFLNASDMAFGFLFYFVSLVIVICLSIYSSVVAARYVEKPLSFRANSSVAFRMISVFAVMSLILIKYYSIALLLIPIYLIASFVIIQLSFRNYDIYKYNLFEKLFKSGA